MAKQKKQFEGKGVGKTKACKRKFYDNPWDSSIGIGDLTDKIRSIGCIKANRLG